MTSKMFGAMAPDPHRRRPRDGRADALVRTGNGRIDFADVVWLFNHL